MFSLTESDDYVSDDCNGEFRLDTGQQGQSKTVFITFHTDSTALEETEVLLLRLQLRTTSMREVVSARNIFFLDGLNISVNDTTGT